MIVLLFKRFAVTHIVCMSCGTDQKVSPKCIVPSCNQVFSKYVCDM